MSMKFLVRAITLLAIFAMALRVSVDTDTWWHLRTGELILEERSIPKTDAFSFTRFGENWQYPSAAWISEVSLFAIYDRFGPAGLNVLAAVMVALAFAFLHMTLSGGKFLRAFFLIFGAAASGIFWAARPYLATFVLSAVFLWILEDYRWGRKNRLVLLPFLMILWANSHPGFAVGFILLGIYLLDGAIEIVTENRNTRKGKRTQPSLRFFWRGKIRAFTLVGVLMLFAVSINPSGPVLLKYPLETVSIGVLQDFIQEWQSPDFHESGMQPFLWLLLASVVSLGFSQKKIVASDLLLILVFGYLGLLAGRNIPLFALAAPLVLTRHAAPLLDELGDRLGIQSGREQDAPNWQRIANVTILILVIIPVALRAALVLPEDQNRAAYEQYLPTAAIEIIRGQEPPGRLFNSYNWGGYIIWELRDYPVFTDGRTDLYNDEILQEWVEIVGANYGWEGKLDFWDVNLVLLEPRWPLSRVLLADERWTLVYEDEVSVLFQRQTE